MLIELPGGFVIPLEWFIAVFAIIVILVPFSILGIYKLIFHDTEGPDEEDLLAMPVVDEHGTIQEGPLLTNLERTEDELLVPVPNWVDPENPKGDPPVFPV